MKTVAISTLAVLVALTSAAACSQTHDGKATPSPATTAVKRTASPAAERPRTDDMGAARQAAAALVPGGDLPTADVIAGGEGGMDGMNRDDSVKRGLRLVIEAACVGTGTVPST